jgi:hypothetical protein
MFKKAGAKTPAFYYPNGFELNTESHLILRSPPEAGGVGPNPPKENKK